MKIKLLNKLRKQADRNLTHIDSTNTYNTYINGYEYKTDKISDTYSLDNFIQNSILNEIYRLKKLKHNNNFIRNTTLYAFIMSIILLISYIAFLTFILVVVHP